jgi:hypothetical protein
VILQQAAVLSSFASTRGRRKQVLYLITAAERYERSGHVSVTIAEAVIVQRANNLSRPTERVFPSLHPGKFMPSSRANTAVETCAKLFELCFRSAGLHSWGIPGSHDTFRLIAGMGSGCRQSRRYLGGLHSGVSGEQASLGNGDYISITSRIFRAAPQ